VPFEQTQQFTFMFLQMLGGGGAVEKKGTTICRIWPGSFSLWYTLFLTSLWG